MAITEVQVTHRPSALKQTNKSHKTGKHRSKGAINSLSKGKVSLKTITKRNKKELGREARKHQAAQIRRNKRDEVLFKKRCLGGSDYAPFLVCLLPLHSQMDTEAAISILSTCDEQAVVNKSESGVTHISLPRFKQRFSFVIPPKDNFFAILDTLKMCDSVLLLLSAVAGIDFGAEVIDEWGHEVMMAALAQGFPTPCVTVMDLESVHPKKRTETKQSIQKLISKWLPDEKVMNFDKNSDAINILRKLGNQKQKSVFYRDKRPHLYGESVEYINDEQGTMGILKVSGYLRGASLSVNGLVHIPGLGDFQMSEIDAPSDPFALDKNRKGESSMDEGSSSSSNTIVIRVLEKSDPLKQVTLVRENIPDPMDAEQTWPTEEELREAENEMASEKAKKIIKKVPKGWSDYQAAWIPDVDAESVSGSESGEEEEEEDDDGMSYSDAVSEEEDSDNEDFKTIVTESEIRVSDDKYDQDLDIKAEQVELQKLKEAKSDMLFPDEIDTPQDVPARERFQKYRGLESFRTSPWDVKENLPSNYARIFQFENFDRTRKRVFKENENKEGALPGWFITIHVTGVSQQLWQAFCETKSPVVIIGLLSHEHKMSVLNVVLKRTLNYNAPVKSKEKLLFQCGYRRFTTCPVFSQHTNGSKHKYERFFQPESTTVATFFAPIQFQPSPVLCYKEVNGKLILIATGSLLSVNPDRLIIKRIVLSGHPFKVHKKSAVIRFMFFNREDIVYFKPVKLRTKHGRHGHIKEPLGTHGHMKCIFDGALKSQDTILLNLFKRVFPKWTYEECIVSCDDTDKMQE